MVIKQSYARCEGSKIIVLYLDTIDIADMQAVVQKLSDASFNTYGSQYLQYRANYVLVKVFRKYTLCSWTFPAL